jgi:hypothetical protein
MFHGAIARSITGQQRQQHQQLPLRAVSLLLSLTTAAPLPIRIAVSNISSLGARSISSGGVHIVVEASMLDVAASGSSVLLSLGDAQGSASGVQRGTANSRCVHAYVTTAVADVQHDQAVEDGVMHVHVVWYTCMYLALPFKHMFCRFATPVHCR